MKSPGAVQILLIVQYKNNILSKVYKLNIDPKQIRSERVESTKSWDEECVDDTKQECIGWGIYLNRVLKN